MYYDMKGSWRIQDFEKGGADMRDHTHLSPTMVGAEVSNFLGYVTSRCPEMALSCLLEKCFQIVFI